MSGMEGPFTRVMEGTLLDQIKTMAMGGGGGPNTGSCWMAPNLMLRYPNDQLVDYCKSMEFCQRCKAFSNVGEGLPNGAFMYAMMLAWHSHNIAVFLLLARAN